MPGGRSIVSHLLAERSDDFLARDDVTRVLENFDREVARVLTRLRTPESIEFLEELEGALRRELEAEDELDAEFAHLRRELEAAGSAAEIALLHRRIREVVGGYFIRTRAAGDFFSLSCAYRDDVIRRVLHLAEEGGEGPRAGSLRRYAWLSVGRGGREEPLPSSDHEAILVFADPEDEYYFEQFTGRARALLHEAGVSGSSAFPAEAGRRGSLGQWRARIGDCLSRGDCEGFDNVIELADARLLHGDPALAGDFFVLLRGGLEWYRDLLRRTARESAALPLAIRFLGWFRVERTGVHRGEINLRQYALDPLISGVRLLSVMNAVWETSTPGRIRMLLHRGRLDVSLAERLLKAYLDFSALEIGAYVRGAAATDDSGYVSPDFLSPEEEQVLREGLEAVETLQRIMYTEYGG